MTFQSIAIFLIELSGIPIQTFEIYIFPSLAALLPIAAFTTYRSLTGRNSTALLATLILFVQPDFLFVTWRGSHEKFTWMMALLLLFLLSRSFAPNYRNKGIARNMVIFYFIAFAFISSNAFFASSFISALAISFIAAVVWIQLRTRIRRAAPAEVQTHLYRLFFLTLTCGVLLYIFFFHIYPPALNLLRAFRSLVDSLSALFLARSTTVTQVDAYTYVTSTWVDSRLFLVLSSLGFSVAGVSGLVWLSGVPRFLLKEVDEDDMPRFYVWLIYPAFALQLVLSVFADRSDTVGSNLQVRLFTPLMLVAIPLTAIGFHAFFVRLRWRLVRWFFLTASTLAFCLLPVLALFKATNEPLISNNWIFTGAAERAAADWIITYSIRPFIWEGRDVRLRFYASFYNTSFPAGSFRGGLVVPFGIRYYIRSQLEQLRWTRIGNVELYLDEEYLTYDNGDVQVIYRRPRTPYQP
jgi:hypothetical protein